MIRLNSKQDRNPTCHPVEGRRARCVTFSATDDTAAGMSWTSGEGGFKSFAKDSDLHSVLVLPCRVFSTNQSTPGEGLWESFSKGLAEDGSAFRVGSS